MAQALPAPIKLKLKLLALKRRRARAAALASYIALRKAAQALEALNLSRADIGRILGVSRQRAHQLLTT